MALNFVARRRYGATAARGIPDPKVGGSNPSSVMLIFSLRKKKKFRRLPASVLLNSGLPAGCKFVSRRYGATAARGIPDPKVGGSNPSSVKLIFCCCCILARLRSVFCGVAIIHRCVIFFVSKKAVLLL